MNRRVLVAAAVLAGAAVGILAGFVATRFQPTLYRSDTVLVVERAGEPVAEGADAPSLVQTVRDLLTTDIVTQVVIRNLSLGERSATFDRHVHVVDDGSGALRVHVDDRSQTRATEIAQELGIVFTQIVQDRFGQGAQPVQVVVFDPANDAGKVSPPTGRDLGWGALLGGLAGLLLVSLWLRRTDGVAPWRLAGTVPEMADLLLARSAEHPFQTVLVTGSDGERVAAGLADTLAGRGEQALWLRSADASPQELARLAAHAGYVFVSAGSTSGRLARRVDLVVAV